MPSKKPRLALTLPEHRHALLKRLADLQGVSMAALVTDLLDDFYPVLERVCIAIEAARAASDQVKVGVREACDRAIAEMEPYRQQATAQLDIFLDDIRQKASASPTADDGKRSAAAGGGEVGASGGGPDGVNPRVVTRGSGFQPPLPRKRSQTPRNPRQKGDSA